MFKQPVTFQNAKKNLQRCFEKTSRTWVKRDTQIPNVKQYKAKNKNKVPLGCCDGCSPPPTPTPFFLFFLYMATVEKKIIKQTYSFNSALYHSC